MIDHTLRRSSATLAAILLLAATAARAPAQEQEEGPPATALSPRQSYLGVVLADVSENDLERLGLSEPRGALVREVVEGSPASEAGLRSGDVIVAWRGEGVYSAAELQRLVRETPAGRSVQVAVLRDGERITLSAAPEEASGARGFLRGRVPPGAHERMHERMKDVRRRWREARGRLKGLDERLGEMGERLEGEWGWGDAADSVRVEVFGRDMPGGDERARLGLRLMELTPQLAEYFGLGDRSGVLVASVQRESPADSAGLRAGDVLLSVAGRNVSDAGDAARAVRDATGETEVRILRRGEERTIGVVLPDRRGSGE